MSPLISFHPLKKIFKQATEIWLIYLVIGILLGFDFMMGNQAKDTLGVCMQGAAMILAIPYFLSLLYVFGVQSRFVNPVKDTIRYSFFMALRNMKCTIQMAILMILLVWANTTVLLVNFLTLVYGFGLMGYFFAAYYKKAFGKYLNPEEIHKTDASEKLHNMKQQKTYYSKKQMMQGGKYVFIY